MSHALIKRPRLFYEDRLTTRATHHDALFPYFDDGDVIIQLYDGESIWTLRLHRRTLEERSRPIILLLSEEGHYQGGPEGFAFHLTLAPPRGDDPIAALTLRRRELVETNSDVCIAYRSFFANLYQQPLLISSSNILLAQYQAEILVHIAKRYGTLEGLRPYLDTHFTSFHVTLFQNICLNPARWLSLALDMRSEVMYQEALVHLIGMYPNHTTWKYTEQNIRPEVLKVIRTKGEQLQHQISLCINEIFTITLPANMSATGKVPAMTLNYQSIERWTVVHLHRDWLADKLRRIKVFDELRGPQPSATGVRPRPLETARPVGIGMLFRAIVTGDYLPWDRVQASLIDAFDFIRMEKFAGLEQDLRFLKRQAQKVITRMGLAKKNLILDEETAKELTYLVCADVGEDDCFWKNKR
ncbi:hypothetical protein IWX90DRAFT_418940 [Phyllosticta citrichinensis]|uniref:Uncharacterized protein n=1 Tax=Phyllosticta citrichinensis TaxID=1130410 RepID=A0ABR1XH14_9PEZI